MRDNRLMSKHSKAKCFFETSDNEDGSFWISVSPQDAPLELGGREIAIGFDLNADTPLKEADEFAAQMRKYISHVRIWFD